MLGLDSRNVSSLKEPLKKVLILTEVILEEGSETLKGIEIVTLYTVELGHYSKLRVVG